MLKYVDVSKDSFLNFRVEPEGEIIGKLKYGTPVEVICDNGDWSNIKINNVLGYVSSKYLSNINPLAVRDPVTSARIELLHPNIREEVRRLIVEAESNLVPSRAVRIVQGLRTFEEQAALYAQGRTKPGPIVTNAVAGSSYHQYGLAIDFAILVDKDGNGVYDELSWDIKADNDKDGTADWLEVVKVFEKAGYEWGGKWSSIKDYPHLQKKFGYTWRQLLDKYTTKQFIEGTKYVKI